MPPHSLRQEREGTVKEKKFSYHYVIVIACFIMMAATVGITVNTFTIISPAMIADLGITATQVQLISLVSTFGNMGAGLFVGRIMAKFGMRKTMTVGTILMCSGFALRGASSTMLTLCASNLLCGLGMAEISTIPSGVLVNNWFSMEKKGTMSGIAFAGSVFGGIVFVQVANLLMKTYDWRVTHYVLAAICAVLMLPISMFVVRARPEDQGLCPLGSENAVGGGSCPVVTGISGKKFFKTGSFWLLAVTVFVIGFTNMGIQRNFAICLQNEHGHSEDFAAMVYSAVMLIQIFGKLILGRVYDKKGVKVGTIYNTVLAIATVAFAVVSSNPIMAVCFGVIFGLLGSMTTVTPPYLTALIVGRKYYAVIFGVVNVFFNVGVAVGPVVAARIFDATGSFNSAWIAFAVLSVIITFTTVMSTRHAAEYRSMTD